MKNAHTMYVQGSVGLHLTPARAKQLLKEAGEGKGRLAISVHAGARMKQRKIGRTQVLETLKYGSFVEPLHRDVKGDWRCSVGWFHAGSRIVVAVVIKLDDKGDLVVVATVFREG